MTLSRIWVLAAVPLVMLACAEEPEPVVEEAMVGEPAAGTPVVGAGEPRVVHPTVELQPQNNSGVTGTATFAAAGDTVSQVAVQLRNLPAGTHAGHIHQGSCASPGSVVAPLEPISPGADAVGTMETTVALPLQSILNGQHLVAYHEAGGSPGAVIACGDIPEVQM